MKRLLVGVLLLAVVRLAAETGSAAASSAAWAQEEVELQGMVLYRQYCAQCHGDQGDGLGLAAPLLSPKPRDFTAAKYKIRSTPTGELPTDDDLELAIRRGLPYTAMPAFDWLTDAQVAGLVEVVKSFSADFQDPDLTPEPLDLPSPPSYSEERAAAGRDVYERTGCARCHGALGRGDGMSAPTLVDDQGDFIRVADLTMPWTFRAGGAREDIFRTMSVGFNGTPMPGFADALSEEERWQITDYMLSLAWADAADPYADYVTAVGVDSEIDLDDADALFAEAEPALFPVVGQIVQPGRNFNPAALAVQVQVIYNPREIAVRLAWHDMTAETASRNAPDLPAPEPKRPGEPMVLPGEGEAAIPTAALAQAAPTQEGSEPAGDAEGTSTAEAGAAPEAGSGEGPFSDAVAIQLPRTAPAGVRWPNFLLGDDRNPVELWFADLAGPEARMYVARGSDQIEAADAGELEVRAAYADGAWTVTFKRPLAPAAGLAFVEDEFIPAAFTVWDGRTGERGNRRGLTRWYSIYVEPLDKPSPLGPVVRAGLGVLGFELLLIFAVRRWRRRREASATGD
ncbi:MAG: c-type cytochrome [Thermoanaerobaculia bacterium]